VSKQAILYGVLLSLSLVGSYWTWTHPETPLAGEEVMVLDAKAEDITTILWDSEKLDLRLTVSEDAAGRYLLVKSTEQKRRLKPHSEEAPAPVEATPPSPETPPAEDPAKPEEDRFETYEEVKEFKAGKAGDELLTALSPMIAKRSLSNLPDEKLAPLGLAEPEATLTIQRAGKPDRVFDVGGEAFGTRDRYLREKDTGTIYLVKEDLIRPLKHGTTRLPDRELVGVEMKELAKVTVKDATGAERSFEHRNRVDEKAAYWGAVGEEGSLEPAKTWVEALLKLKSTSFVAAEDTPTTTTVMATIVTEDAKGQKVTLELIKGTDADGKEAWYAKSTHTRLLVKMSSAQTGDLVADIPTVMGAKAQ